MVLMELGMRHYVGGMKFYKKIKKYEIKQLDKCPFFGVQIFYKEVKL